METRGPKDEQSLLRWKIFKVGPELLCYRSPELLRASLIYSYTSAQQFRTNFKNVNHSKCPFQRLPVTSAIKMFISFSLISQL